MRWPHHQEWLAEVFGDVLPADAAARRHVLLELHAATDVYTWKLLRRDMGRPRARAESSRSRHKNPAASAQRQARL